MERFLLILMAGMLLFGCGPQRTPFTNPEGAAPVAHNPNDVEARIEQVENGLVKMYATGPSRLGGKLTLAERMEHYQVPGVSIAIIDDFKIDWARGYGVLEAGGAELVTAETLFHAGSMAKSISAAAALGLVEGGLLVYRNAPHFKRIRFQPGL